MSDIDELVEQFSSSLTPHRIANNINISSATPEQQPPQTHEIQNTPPLQQIIHPPRLIMPVNYQLLKLYIDIIPPYNGDAHTLGIFIESAENLINAFSHHNDADLNSFMLRAIIGKLIGRALTLIGSRTELRTWQQIKETLNLCFGDQRNIDCLVQDLLALHPQKTENTL